MTALELWLASIGFAGCIGLRFGRKWDALALAAIAAFGFLVLAVLKTLA